MTGSGKEGSGLPAAAWWRLMALLFVALVVMGAAGWGVGRLAGVLVDGWRASAPAAVPPTAVPPTATGTPEMPAPSATMTEMPATATLRPTSTPGPTSTPTPAPVESWEIVQPGEGLYALCRRHCPGIGNALDNYAREVASRNNIPWPWRGQPKIYAGQRLSMPPCPR